MHSLRGALCRGIDRQRGLQAVFRTGCATILPDPADHAALDVHAIRHYSRLTLDDAREDQHAERPTTPWVRTGKFL